MLCFQSIQPATQKTEHEKEIANDQNRINDQLNRKSSQRFGGFLFHGAVDLFEA